MRNIHVEVVRGNILNVLSDAVVLPANRGLREGSGTSAAIFQAAGRKQLTEACREIGSCEEGKAVVTPGFALRADYIIHTVVPRWVDGQHNEYECLCASYLAALNTADILRCASVAFPLLGAGNNGYDLNLAFEIAYRTMQQFEGRVLETAYLVVFGERAARMAAGKEISYVEFPETAVPYQESSHELSQVSPDAVKRRNMIDQAIAQAGAFLGKKENWDDMLDVAYKIVGLIKMLCK